VENSRGGIAENRGAHVIVVGGQVEGDSAGGNATVVGDAFLAAESVLGVMRAGLRGDIELTSARSDVEDADLTTSDSYFRHRLAVYNPAQR